MLSVILAYIYNGVYQKSPKSHIRGRQVLVSILIATYDRIGLLFEDSRVESSSRMVL